MRILLFDTFSLYRIKNNGYYRLNGPAVEHANGTKCWYQNGKLHRLDGPAIKTANGTNQWWVEGVLYSEEKFKERVKK